MLFVFAPYAVVMSIVLLIEHWNTMKYLAMRDGKKRLAKEKVSSVKEKYSNIGFEDEDVGHGTRLSPETRWSSVRTESVFLSILVADRTWMGR